MGQQQTSLEPSITERFSNGLPSSVDDSYNTWRKACDLASDFITYKTVPGAPAPRDEACRTLRRVGDEILESHPTVVNAVSKRVQYSENRQQISQANHDSANHSNGKNNINQQKFLTIARGLTQDGKENWGRIVTIYVVGSILALNNLQYENGSDVENIIHFVGDYVGTNKRVWIENNGGWNGFVRFFSGSARSDERRL